MKLKPIPKEGILGEVALREAAAGEFHAIMNLVQRALQTVLFPGRADAYVSIEAMFADRAIVRTDGRLYAYPYTISDDNQVTLGQAEEVVQQFEAVSARMSEAMTDHAAGDQGAFLEAKDEKGKKWRIRVIEAGLSGNKNYYPDTVLREAAPLFDGVRVFVKPDEDHLKGKGKSFDNLIGRLSAPRFVEGQGKDTGHIEADLELLSSSGDVPAKMLEAYNRNMADLFGFSVDMRGRAKVQRGKRVAQSVEKVDSVDLIIEPGAGGQIINLLEAQDPEVEADMALRTRMIEAIKKANNGALPDGLDEHDDDAVEAAYREALVKNNPPESAAKAAGAGEPAPAQAGVTREELDAQLRMVEARAHVRTALASSKLPEVAVARLQKHFDGLQQFTEAQVDEAIAQEREYLATFTESGHVRGAGDTSHIESGEDRSEKVAKMFDDFFDKKNRDVRSFRECYIEVTGDRRVTGHLQDCDPVRMREALGGLTAFRESVDTTAFSVVLGNSITRRMLADYANESMYDAWRRIANVVPVNDFRTQERTRYGGYGDLPAVAEKAAYGALASPTDEKATYAVTKRGGTEDVSLEAIKNDDVGLIQGIPVKLSRSAKRTLGKFVFDFIANNPLIYDGVALYAAGHNNLGTTALSATTLAAGRLAMLKQTEKDSGERLGIMPRTLLVSADGEEGAVDLFRRNTENDANFVQSLSLDVIPVWYWTDANDWALAADPDEAPFIEIGFLDGNEEPEIFVQDMPTQGSLFSNDMITYKIRHVYGGNVTDFRPTYKAVVP